MIWNMYLIGSWSPIKVLETLGLIMTRESRIWLKTRDLMGERNALVKSHIPGDGIHEKYLSFGARTAGTCGVLELGFLSFFSSFASNFLSFGLMIWLGYVLIMFLCLNWLKSYYLGSKDVT